MAQVLTTQLFPFGCATPVTPADEIFSTLWGPFTLEEAMTIYWKRNWNQTTITFSEPLNITAELGDMSFDISYPGGTLAGYTPAITSERQLVCFPFCNPSFIDSQHQEFPGSPPDSYDQVGDASVSCSFYLYGAYVYNGEYYIDAYVTAVFSAWLAILDAPTQCILYTNGLQYSLDPEIPPELTGSVSVNFFGKTKTMYYWFTQIIDAGSASYTMPETISVSTVGTWPYDP